MTHYWPMSGSLNDLIDGKDMTIIENCRLIEDRFGNYESALLIEKGLATLPSSIYFDPTTGGFTIMLWVKALSINPYARIFEFFTTDETHIIRIYFQASTLEPLFQIYQPSYNNVIYFIIQYFNYLK